MKNDGKIIIVPEGTRKIDAYAFAGNTVVEEIVLPNTVEFIYEGAFSGCTNLKKINLPNSICFINYGIFKNCTSLREITLPKSITCIIDSMFEGCTNLRKINALSEIQYIYEKAFINCKKLKDFPFNDSLKFIEKQAFSGCTSLKEIYIGKNVRRIENDAFDFTNSLEKIVVSKENEKYFSNEKENALFTKGQYASLLKYAPKSKEKEFSIEEAHEKIKVMDGVYGKKSIPVMYINSHAFHNAKNLEKVSIPLVIGSFYSSTFLGCDNLDTLEIYNSYFDEVLSFVMLLENGKKAYIPFSNIIIGDGVYTLFSGLSSIFVNANNVTLPRSLSNISSGVFKNSKFLKSIKIPNNVFTIEENAFNPNTILEIEDLPPIKASEFFDLKYKNLEKKYNTKIYSLKDGTYYIRINEYKPIKITKKEIENIFGETIYIEEALVHLIELYNLNKLDHKYFESIIKNQNIKDIYSKKLDVEDYIEEITNINKNDEFIFNEKLIKRFNLDERIKIIRNYNKSLDRFFKFSNLDYENNVLVDDIILYTEALDKYQKYDKFLYNTVFYKVNDIDTFVKNYNTNFRNMLIRSEVLEDAEGYNLNDLLNLCKALGVFEGDEVLSQKILMFLTEKMFDKNILTGDNLHRAFESLCVREKVDYEFINFFIKNFDELIKLEKSTPQIISRIYNSFEEIKRTSTSHKGMQRRLVVTIDKCLSYFLVTKEAINNEENKELAKVIYNFYSEREALKIAKQIVKQSESAPRNIFCESNEESEDLVEETSEDFSYQWLPKQDYKNLVLGKYVNCCAHVLGNGAGIMRASMVSDSHQNLVIMNKNKKIIGKMTIYVNREKGYAVFNTAEINPNYLDKSSLTGIYKCFLRGTEAFIEKYNSNNEVKIETVTIGKNRNQLVYFLESYDSVLPVTDYSNYSYMTSNDLIGLYKGDAKKEQLLVLKKNRYDISNKQIDWSI